MNIESNDYRLIHVKKSYLYNLELLTVINKNKETKRIELKHSAYGCTLESCLKRILSNRIINKTGDVREMQMLLLQYQSNHKKLLSLLEPFEIIKTK